jgi:hypothetical protein
MGYGLGQCHVSVSRCQCHEFATWNHFLYATCKHEKWHGLAANRSWLATGIGDNGYVTIVHKFAKQLRR